MDETGSRKYPVDEHFRFQRRTWIVERVGWVVLIAISLVALTGLFGTGGPLESGLVTGKTLSIDYQRFERRTRLARFIFRFSGGSAEHTLHLNDAFRNTYEITDIQPRPAGGAAEAHGYDLTFSSKASSPGAVTVWAKPHRMGVIHIAASSGDAPPLDFTVLFYP